MHRLRLFFLFVLALSGLIGCVVGEGGGTPQPTATDSTELVQPLFPTPQFINDASRDCDNPVPMERRFPLPPWKITNFCLHSVSYDEIRSGGVGKDRIVAIDAPIFETLEQGDLWLADVEPVLVFELNGDARAYPLPILVWHEIVNDVVGGTPIVVTYCPLCDSGLVFERELGDRLLDFGTTGNLRNADLIMYDRQTESWWQQFTGEAIVGDMLVAQLTLLPASLVSWGDFKAQFGNGRVLSPDTGLELFYGETPYINYDSISNPNTGFLDGDADGRLPPKMRVMGVNVRGTAVAYPYSLLSEVAVVNDTQHGQPLVVFWKAGTTSPLYKEVIADSRDVGSSAIFDAELDGQHLTFRAEADGFVDEQTSSRWNIFGIATDGALMGQRLTPLSGHEFLWFSWARFRPDTLIYGSDN